MYTYHDRACDLCRALDPQNLIQLLHGFVSLGEATRKLVRENMEAFAVSANQCQGLMHLMDSWPSFDSHMATQLGSVFSRTREFAARRRRPVAGSSNLTAA
jgi:hypothetical protein